MNKMLPLSQENFDKVTNAVIGLNQKIDSIAGVKGLVWLALLGEAAILGVMMI